MEPGSNICRKCGKTFLSAHGLRRHYRNIDCKRSKYSECKNCGCTFMCLASHRCRGKLECDYCGRIIGDKEMMVAHLLKHTRPKRHPRARGRVRILPCEVCMKPFTNKAAKAIHEAIAHGTQSQEWWGEVNEELGYKSCEATEENNDTTANKTLEIAITVPVEEFPQKSRPFEQAKAPPPIDAQSTSSSIGREEVMTRPSTNFRCARCEAAFFGLAGLNRHMRCHEMLDRKARERAAAEEARKRAAAEETEASSSP